MAVLYLNYGGGTHLSKFRKRCTKLGEFYCKLYLKNHEEQFKLFFFIILNATKKLCMQDEIISSGRGTMQRKQY